MNSNWSYCPETLNSGQNQRFLSLVTLKFDGWAWKTIGHLFYATLSFMHHSKAIGEFKLELQSGNTQFRSKSVIFLSRVTSKFDGWPWKIIRHLFNVASSFVHHFIAIGEFKLKLQSGNAQFGSKSVIYCPVWPWNLTDDLENNRAPLQCCFKLYASFYSHQWIQTKVTVRKRSIRVKIGNFFVPCDLEIWRMTLKSNRAFFCPFTMLLQALYITS